MWNFCNRCWLSLVGMLTDTLLNINRCDLLRAQVFIDSHNWLHSFTDFRQLSGHFPPELSPTGTAHFVIITFNRHVEKIWLVLELSSSPFSSFEWIENGVSDFKGEATSSMKMSLLIVPHAITICGQHLTLIIRFDLRTCHVMVGFLYIF